MRTPIQREPRTLDARINREQCACGHGRRLHRGVPPVQGHGSCAVKGCACAKYTWVPETDTAPCLS